MATMAESAGQTRSMTGEERFVIFASSLGTVFEWYDFYLYAILAPFFASLFFPPGKETAHELGSQRRRRQGQRQAPERRHRSRQISRRLASTFGIGAKTKRLSMACPTASS
jgi:hypothetical protein